MSAQPASSRKTVGDLRAARGTTPLVCLTAYTAPVARLIDPHVDMILVGDSVGMVMHGLPSTLGVDLEMMILHAKAVMRGSKRALVVVDMPFGSYESGWQLAFDNAVRLLRETGCQAIKIECGPFVADTIKALTDRGVPVLAHIGLRPQSVLLEGRYRVRGRSPEARRRMLDEAAEAEEAGAFALVVEGVPPDLASEITGCAGIPTIGIGASAQCDGQIVVIDDMLGMFATTPRFVRRYGETARLIERAVSRFADDVRARRFPSVQETYAVVPGEAATPEPGDRKELLR